jgi:NADH-quinone oxidoreductase subunit N
MIFFNDDIFAFIFCQIVVFIGNFTLNNNFFFIELYIYFFLVLSAFFIFITYLNVLRIRIIEFSFLLLIVVIGLFLLLIANDLIFLYFCFEIVALLTYVLLGFSYDLDDRYEGVIKYFIINSVASIFILFGTSIFYLETLNTNFISLTLIYLEVEQFSFLSGVAILFLVLGLLVKIASFPCLVWIIDVYESISLSLLSILVTVYKFCYVYVLIKLVFHIFYMFNTILIPILFCSALGSLIIGSLGALIQFKLKRFIGYTSVAQTGYLLLSIATGTYTGAINSFNFIIFYVVSNILFFFFLCQYEIDNKKKLIYLTDLSILNSNQKNSSIFVLIVMSLASLPPLSAFFIKYSLISEMVFLSLQCIVTFVLFCSLISMYYYIRIIKIVFFDFLPIYFNNKTHKINIVILPVKNQLSVIFFQLLYIFQLRYLTTNRDLINNFIIFNFYTKISNYFIQTIIFSLNFMVLLFFYL